jgi:hypothetical protein
MSRPPSALAVLVLACAVVAGPVRAEERKPAAAPYVHTVIIRLKKGAPAAEADAIIADARKLLAKIGTVRGLWAGRPSDMATPRAAQPFDVGLLVLFDNADGLKKYIDDPLHKKFVEKHLKYVDEEKMAVFDFVTPKTKTKESK